MKVVVSVAVTVLTLLFLYNFLIKEDKPVRCYPRLKGINTFCEGEE